MTVPFLQKMQELVITSLADPSIAESVNAQAEALMEQFRDWPVNTQVPLSYVATIVAAMVLEPNVHVRRRKVDDGIELRSYAG